MVFSSLLLLVGCASTTTPHGPSLGRTPPRSGCSYAEPTNRPDPACTPGVTNPAVTQQNLSTTICEAGWTKTVRPTVAYTDKLKLSQMRQYGLSGSPGLYEEDHRVPLEVGGNPSSPLNLWPEPWGGQYGAHAKDAVENRVKRAVCSGQMTLRAGQQVFLGDWWVDGQG